jgi:hypothetical protein
MPITDIFTEADIKDHLKSYKKIKNFDKINRWTHVKYFTFIKDKKYQYKIGGLLKYTYEDYIVLISGKRSWSVQKKNNVFFAKYVVNEKQLKEEIYSNNKLIRELGGDQKKMISEDNDDIFSSLRKAVRPSKASVQEIKDKFDLKGWIHTNPNKILTSDVIKYVNLKGDKLSQEANVKDIFINKNYTIRSIQLENVDSEYRWKINPHKYYIFKHPMSEIKALLKKMDQ